MRAWERSRVAGPGVVLVGGPSGVGKSALVHELAARVLAAAPGVLCLRGRCFEQESLPFKALDPLVDALVEHLLELPSGEVRALLPAECAAAARLFPVLGRVGAVAEATLAARQRRDPIEERQLGFRGLRELLANVALSRPVLAIIDDLQWGDADSATVLGELLDGGAPPRLLIVAACRADAAEGEGDFLRALVPRLRRMAVLGRVVEVEEIELGPLSTEAAEQAALAALAEPDAERAAQIAREAGGLPFFIRELARAQPRSLPTIGPAPPMLESVVAGLFDGLPAGARALLEALAVAGHPVTRRTAVSAAGPEVDVGALALLRSRRLIRPGPPGRGEQLELYHDWIRRLVAARVSASRRGALHLSLAEALEIERAEPAVLAAHFHHGGRNETAAEYAVAAAERAAAKLAFAAAAEHYGDALAWLDWPASARDELRVRRAEALASSGRGAEAGALYLSLAATATGVDALRFRSAGVDQLLVSGVLYEGTAELRRLARDVGLSFPEKPRAAAMTMVWSLAVLWLRGALTGKAREGLVSAAELLKADVAGCGFRGLLPVAPAAAAYFAVSELYFARRSSEPRRISLALARVGSGVLGSGPRWVARLGARLLDAADSIARDDDDAQLRGSLSVARGAYAFWAGRWAEALGRCDDGLATLRAGARGAGHESNLARVVSVRSLEELGRWAEAQARSEQMLADALARGDLYAQTSARLALGMELLAAGQLDAAEELAHEAVQGWPVDTCSVQEVYSLRVLSYAALARGGAPAAFERLERAWPRIRAGMHLTILASAIDLLSLRGSLAVACGDLREARRCARQLAASGRRDARGHAESLRAAVALMEGRGDEAQVAVQQARQHFAGAGMRARMLALDLLRGDRAASERLSGLGVSEPAVWARWTVPGGSLLFTSGAARL